MHKQIQQERDYNKNRDDTDVIRETTNEGSDAV